MEASTVHAALEGVTVEELADALRHPELSRKTALRRSLGFVPGRDFSSCRPLPRVLTARRVYDAKRDARAGAAPPRAMRET